MHQRAAVTSTPSRLILAVLLFLSMVPAQVLATALDLPATVLQAPPDPDGDPAQWLNRAVGLFDRGALANEARGVRPVTKWPGAIGITVRGDAGKAWLDRVQRIADDLADLTGRAITVEDNPLRAGDMDVYVTNRASYWPFFVEPASGVKDEPFTCIALPSTLNGEIRGSKIHINAGVMPPDGVSACLLEEIFQSMGFFGETPGHPETVLNDDIGYRELGAIDRLLLRTLYDPRLAAGMSRDQALPLVRQILKEKLSDQRR
jgi:Protein of unknown function (DUF2927)